MLGAVVSSLRAAAASCPRSSLASTCSTRAWLRTLSSTSAACEVRVERLAPALGGVVHGLDLMRPGGISPGDLKAVEDALMEHEVVFVHPEAGKPHLTYERHAELAAHFGPAQFHGAFPHVEGHKAITVLENDRENQSKIEKWHTDMTFRACPPLGSILVSRIIAGGGKGDTMFLSLSAAYDALEESMKSRLQGLKAEHSFEFGFQESLNEPGGRERLKDMVEENPPCHHPVIRTHPVSGRKCLFVNSLFTSHIVGMPAAESAALLEELYAHILKDEFQVRFRWQEGSFAFWDNRCTQHVPVNDYWPATRRMERITIDGDRPA